MVELRCAWSSCIVHEMPPPLATLEQFLPYCCLSLRESSRKNALLSRSERRHSLFEQCLADDVHFSGPVSDPAPYPRAADDLVLPSISAGMGNSLLEPMSCGLPAVVSSAGANVDLVKHEESGLVADAGDSGDLACQLTCIIEDPALRNRCDAAARPLIRRQYSLASIVDRYESLYKRLVESKKA